MSNSIKNIEKKLSKLEEKKSKVFTSFYHKMEKQIAFIKKLEKETPDKTELLQAEKEKLKKLQTEFNETRENFMREKESLQDAKIDLSEPKVEKIETKIKAKPEVKPKVKKEELSGERNKRRMRYVDAIEDSRSGEYMTRRKVVLECEEKINKQKEVITVLLESEKKYPDNEELKADIKTAQTLLTNLELSYNTEKRMLKEAFGELGEAIEYGIAEMQKGRDIVSEEMAERRAEKANTFAEVKPELKEKKEEVVDEYFKQKYHEEPSKKSKYSDIKVKPYKYVKRGLSQRLISRHEKGEPFKKKKLSFSEYLFSVGYKPIEK